MTQEKLTASLALEDVASNLIGIADVIQLYSENPNAALTEESYSKALCFLAESIRGISENIEDARLKLCAI